MRLSASHPPWSSPYRSSDVSAYAEQVGVNLHEGGNAGEMNVRYPRTRSMAPLRGKAAIVWVTSLKG